MSGDRLYQDAAVLFKRLAGFMHAYPQIRSAIDAELEVFDGFPIRESRPRVIPVFVGVCLETGCGAVRPCGEHDTPVRMSTLEAAAIARTGSNDDRIIRAALNTIAGALDKLEPVKRRHLPAPEPARCNRGVGQRLDGHLEWQNAQCVAYPGATPIVTGMCDDCLTLCNQWRHDHGMEPVTRETSSYIQPRNQRGRYEKATA